MSTEKAYAFKSEKPYSLFIDEASMIGYMDIFHLITP